MENKIYFCFGGRFRIRYVYFDTDDYLADSIFVRNKIKVCYGHEWTKEGEPYRMIECKIQKKNKARFEESFKEVINKMHLTGHTDYEGYCKKMIKSFKGYANENKKL